MPEQNLQSSAFPTLGVASAVGEGSMVVSFVHEVLEEM